MPRTSARPTTLLARESGDFESFNNHKKRFAPTEKLEKHGKIWIKMDGSGENGSLLFIRQSLRQTKYR